MQRILVCVCVASSCQLAFACLLFPSLLGKVYYVFLYCILLYCIVLYCIVLCCIVLCCISLCCCIVTVGLSRHDYLFIYLFIYSSMHISTSEPYKALKMQAERSFVYIDAPCLGSVFSASPSDTPLDRNHSKGSWVTRWLTEIIATFSSFLCRWVIVCDN